MQQREIKFRCWDTEDEQWYYFVLHSTKEDMEKADHINFAGKVYHYLYTQRLDSKSWGEYTGLKDKNDKEIYEGDIIHIEKTQYPSLGEETIKVEWLEGITGYFPFRNYSYIQDKIEVIGNIYENKELLK